MENEIIGIAHAPNSTCDINERVAITELLETGASWMGMVACWWAMMLMQGGIFFTLETKDCMFVIVIFLFICFRHWLYFCPQASRSLTEANRSLWANNIQQLALPIGFISRLFYWCKLVSAIICVVLSMMRLVSQDFGKEKVENNQNMTTRNFALNVFYVLAFIETVLLLVALVLQMVFERAKEEKKKQRKEEKEDEKKEEMEHETIDIPDQTNICSEQQDSSDPMPNNNGDDTCHKLSGEITPRMITSIMLLGMMRVLMIALPTVELLQQDEIFFTLKTKDCILVNVMWISIWIRFFHFYLQTMRSRSVLANNIQQLALPIGRPLFYIFQLVSAWTSVVLSMMGLVSQYFSQTELMSLFDTQHLRFYYWTLAEALMSLLVMRFFRIITMRQTVTEVLFEGATDQSNNFRPNRRMELIKAPSEYPAEKCKQTEEMKAEMKKSQ